MTNSTRTLDLDQLATVAGGTAEETAELKAAILGNPDLAKIWQRKTDRYGFDDATTCHMVLLEAFGVLYAECIEADSNVYAVNVDCEEKYRLSQSDVIALVNNYKAF